jgi:hypothetical protein
MPVDLALELDDADVILSRGGVVASSLVDVYGRALSMFTPASRALSCALSHGGRPPVALADCVCP